MSALTKRIAREHAGSFFDMDSRHWICAGCEERVGRHPLRHIAELTEAAIAALLPDLIASAIVGVEPLIESNRDAAAVDRIAAKWRQESGADILARIAGGDQ